MLSTTSGAASGGGMANPNMTQAVAIQNYFFDRHFVNFRKHQKQYYSPFGDVTTEEVFDLKTRELAFMLKKSTDSFVQRNVNPQKDHELRVFSSANGLPDFFSNIRDQNADIASIRDSIVFAGVPLVDIRAGNENQSDAVAVMVSGSTTIFNTGSFDIGVGDIILWDLPVVDGTPSAARPAQPYGIVTRKKLFRTVPLSFASLGANGATQSAASGDTVRGLFESLQKKAIVGGAQRVGKGDFDARRAEIWQTLTDDVHKAAKDSDDEGFKRALGNMLLGWTAEWEALMRRKIGVALSNARPGQQFDSACPRRPAPPSLARAFAPPDVRLVGVPHVAFGVSACPRSPAVQVKKRRAGFKRDEEETPL